MNTSFIIVTVAILLRSFTFFPLVDAVALRIAPSDDRTLPVKYLSVEASAVTEEKVTMQPLFQ